VTIDIEFHRYPCSILSLDVENILKVHLVNINNNLTKYVLPELKEYNDAGYTPDQIRDNVKRQVSERKGCRVIGNFEIDKVPGNFHFASHGYPQYLGEAMANGMSILIIIMQDNSTFHTQFTRFTWETNNPIRHMNTVFQDSNRKSRSLRSF
jgi:hypothetical protein